ncbi:hypothetical protein [Streptomyces sp. NRRL WC-3744]|uniref:hypothetical protein n=1 Tax=Streptomyces sp. NRRL WC-3744 TaxID=1463935 RepID=UPI00068FD07E|nr:hypothetical protein [Streptomyces sp. NRRL WC-3744]
MPLGELTPYPGNARRGDVRLILESLRTSGQYRSLIARQTPDSLVVLAGNHTLAALLAHGRGPCTASIPTFANPDVSCPLCNGVPWEPVARSEVVECDDETALRINLVDNRAAAKGSWDLDGLVAAPGARRAADRGGAKAWNIALSQRDLGCHVDHSLSRSTNAPRSRMRSSTICWALGSARSSCPAWC